MNQLHQLSNSSRESKRRIRVGRGMGSGRGKTCCRGQKGQGARSGYKRRYGFEGGQFPLYLKLPTRGFSNARFRKKMDAINLKQVEMLYQDGETVNVETLREKGFLSGKTHGIKLLGNGTLSKKVTFEIDAISDGAKEKLQSSNIPYSINTQREFKGEKQG